MTQQQPLYRVGDRVVKCTGDYHWDGVVCSVFYTPSNNLRYVVGHPVQQGWVLHIYSEFNLRRPHESQTMGDSTDDAPDGTEEARGNER